MQQSSLRRLTWPAKLPRGETNDVVVVVVVVDVDDDDDDVIVAAVVVATAEPVLPFPLPAMNATPRTYWSNIVARPERGR